MESIRVIQKKIDAVRTSSSLISLNTRLGVTIVKLTLAEVVNA